MRAPQRRDEALLQHKAEEARHKYEAGKREQQSRLGLVGEEHARDDDAASAEKQDAKVLMRRRAVARSRQGAVRVENKTLPGWVWKPQRTTE